MTDTGHTAEVRKITKKEVRKEVYEKLAGALAEYKGSLNEKKFENKLKKASKLFAVDITRAQRKNGKANTKKKQVAEN